MNVIKKFSVGAWITLVAAVMALVSVIVYTVNIGSAGYFQNAAVSNLTVFCVLAVAALVAAIVLGQVKLSGPAATAVALVQGALQIAAPVLLTLCPANLASATGTIANMVCLAAAMVIGIVGAFCGLRKKEK